jgi:TonB family protein
MTYFLARQLICAALITIPAISLAGLPLELQPEIRASTFEVVLKKPTADPLTYEKPLPLDLIPFIERTDQYRSIGTAFALGQNRYISAAHVFAIAIDSQFGAPALRNGNGEVYPIDRILKFSHHGDFVVFSLAKDPAPKGLPVNRVARIDTAVFAVGNALGEGIVIRDGVFTSQTPEEQDGQWKWIRFSAAASPGNSGGPLLDEAGSVIGIVLRKSANENLNYSLPIGLVLDAPSDKAVFDVRELTTLPYMRGTRTYSYRDEFRLPLTWPEFVKAHDAMLARHFDEGISELDKAYADTQFMRGVGVDAVLYSADANFYDSRLIMQQSDNTWSALVSDGRTINLPGDGFVNVGWIDDIALLRLHRSNYSSDDGFYADSKGLMDIALKGLELSRYVGSDEIRITSLGSAQSETAYADHFGRTWQQHVWAMPYRDAYVVGFLLPTPEGYSGMFQIASSAKLRESESVLRLMTDQFSVSYAGTLGQWQSFLRRSALLPKALSGVTLQEKPDFWELRTPRFETHVLKKLFPIGEQGQMGLIMGYLQEHERLVWDTTGVIWTQDAEGKSTVGVTRISRPPKTAKLEVRSAYTDLAARRAPFDAQIIRDRADGYSINQVLDVPGTRAGKSSSDLLYGVSVRLSGANAIDDANELLEKVARSTRILEHGMGGDIEPFHGEPLKIEAMTAALSAADFAPIARGQFDAVYGHDTRGRVMSEDFRDYVLPENTEISKVHGSSAHPSAVQSATAAGLFDYWSKVPAVIHNGDLWSSFLEHNGFPAASSHGLGVVEAQAQLARALGNGAPGPEWAKRAQALIEAYAKERADIARSRGNVFPSVYSARKLPCPKPAEKRSETEIPAITLTRSPEEFYPNSARRAQIEGSVLVAVQVDTSGCGRQRGIVASSGSDDLDQAALDLLDTAEFSPAQRNGAAVEGIFKTIVLFKLQESM